MAIPPWVIIQAERAIYSKKSRVYAQATTLSSDLSRCHSLAHVWKIDNISQKLTDPKMDLTSETFPCPSYDFEAQARLTLEDGSLYVSLTLTNTSPLRRFNLAKTVFLRLNPKVTYVLKHQRHADDQVKMNWQRSFYPTKKRLAFDKEQFKTWLGVDQILLLPSFNVDDSVVLEIHVEPHSLARQVYTDDGVLSWKIPDYSRLKAAAENCFILSADSPYFYTSPQGFRLLVQVFLNRKVGEEELGLVAELSRLSGRFDEQLSDEFVKSVTFVLYNFKDSSKSIEISRKEDFFLQIPLATHAQIEQDGFLKNDTLFYKVIVTTSQTNYSKISRAILCIN